MRSLPDATPKSTKSTAGASGQRPNSLTVTPLTSKANNPDRSEFSKGSKMSQQYEPGITSGVTSVSPNKMKAHNLQFADTKKEDRMKGKSADISYKPSSFYQQNCRWEMTIGLDGSVSFIYTCPLPIPSGDSDDDTTIPELGNFHIDTTERRRRANNSVTRTHRNDGSCEECPPSGLLDCRIDFLDTSTIGNSARSIDLTSPHYCSPATIAQVHHAYRSWLGPFIDDSLPYTDQCHCIPLRQEQVECVEDWSELHVWQLLCDEASRDFHVNFGPD